MTAAPEQQAPNRHMRRKQERHHIRPDKRIGQRKGFIRFIDFA